MPTRSYPHLRGIVVDLREGGLVIAPESPITKSVLIFGKALAGPTNEPVALGNIREAEAIFGPLNDPTGEFTGTASLTTYVYNQITLQAYEAFAGGCTDVRAVRLDLDGVTAYLDLELWTTTASDTLRISAAYPGYIGNSFKVATAYTTGGVDHLRIKLPTYFGGTTYRFLLSDYDTIQELIDNVNRVLEGYVTLELQNQALNDFSPSYLPIMRSDTSTTWETMASAIALGTSPTSAGTYNGVAGTNDTTPTLTSVYDALGDPAADPGVNPTALQILREYEVDFIANSVYYVNEITGASDNFMQRLVDFCHLQHKNGIPTSTILGVSLLAPPFTRANIIARKTALTNTAAYPASLITTGMASTSGDEDIENGGRYLQLVAGPHCMATARPIGWYATNGAVHVAALRSGGPSHRPLTFKPVPGLANIAYRWSNSEANALAGGVGSTDPKGGAYLVLGQWEGNIAPLDGPTCAKRNTDYQESYIIDIADSAVDAIRNVAKKYLGNEFSIAHRNALKQQIQTSLDGMYEAGALVGKEDIGYKFSITQTDADRVLGRLVIDVALRPNLELKWIEVNISMQA